jgi:hypothetical protein
MRSRRVPMPRSPRHSVQIPAQIVRLHDFRLMADSIENLSVGGALAGLSDSATLGDKLLVSFQVPNTQVWLDVDAVVARVIQGRRPTDRCPQLGLRFETMSSNSQRWLQYILQHAPPAAPKTRPGRRDKQMAVRDLVIGSGWTHSRVGQMLVRWWEK